MKTRQRGKVDPIEREIERGLQPDLYIRDRECFSLVGGLEGTAKEIERLITAEPGRAVVLYETFLAGCQAKAEELDDSSGSFGQFAKQLICGWIKARQASGAAPDDTASVLTGWMDDDPYAFCYEMEHLAAKAFNKAGLAALEQRVRARLEGAAAEPSSWEYRRSAEILRTIYAARRNIPAYVALAEQTGLKPQDCLAVANLLAGRKPEEALAWVERGRESSRQDAQGSMASYGLEKLHRELLVRLGRQGEAAESVWAEFREHPSTFTFDELMKFAPKGERAAWREKALDAAGEGDLHSVLELFVETKEAGRLAELVQRTSDEALEKVSHYATEPAAKRLEKSHPGLGARLWRAQGMRIVDAGKSKYYDAALANFERARDCFERAGQAVEWEKTVRRVSAAHFRKTGFIGGFQALAAGAKHEDPPTFLEAAKRRWAGRYRRTQS